MLRDALVEVIRQDLKHVDMGLCSITGVDVSPDLHFARVYVSGFKEDNTRNVVDHLQTARGRIRGYLGKRIHLRYTPELDFKYDETTMRASRIESILMEVAPKNVETANAVDDENSPDQNDNQNDDDDQS